jgi:von Willebrand factor type A domain
MKRTLLRNASLALLVWAAGCAAPPAPVAAPPQPSADDVAAAGAPASPVDAYGPTSITPPPEPPPPVAAAAGPMAPAPSPPAAPAPPRKADVAAAPPPPPPPVREAEKAVAVAAPPPEPVAVMPSPSVKAGEWDDNANYREFQKWLGTEAREPFHRVDVRDRRFIVVRDADGKAMPRCPVTVADERGRRASLTTTASGRAILFPHAEGLAGTALTISTTCQGGDASARIDVSPGDAIVDLKLAIKRRLPASREVDLAFILDTTGSMGEEIAAVKGTLQKVASALSGGGVRVRIGMVEYKDRTDPFVTKTYPMTTDVAAFSQQVAGISAEGGGDEPESVNEGLHVGLTNLAWSGNAVARLAFLIGDAPPHLDYANDFDYAVDMREAAHRGIQVYTVAASGMDDLGQVVWRQIAQYTGATNLFVLRGGAGPQSTGAGDPRSSCGGTQTQYASGNLDALILQKIRRELSSLDRDPMRIAGLYKDESAKPCAERLLVAE